MYRKTSCRTHIDAGYAKYILPPKDDILTSMEAMVHHFVLVTKGPISAAAGEDILGG